MSQTRTGHCLCGAVSYSFDAEPMGVGICHCTDCQRSSGSNQSLVVLLPRDQFQLEGDTLASWTTVGTDSGEERERSFCSRCGSPIMSIRAEADDMVVLKGGTLDDKSWVEPEMEVWVDSAGPWVQLSEERGNFPRGLPT